MTSSSTSSHPLRAGLAFLAVTACLAIPVSADQIVYFSNGKAMTVKSVEKGDKFTILEVDGGGRVGVPTDQIIRIEDLETINPYVAQPPAPQTAAPPPVAPVMVAPPDGTRPGLPALAAGAPTGPGIGGVPNQALGSVRPLDIAGSSDASAGRLQPGPAYGANGGPAYGGAQRLGMGGMMQQAGPAGSRRYGGPAMGGRRSGMGGRPRPDLSQLQPSTSVPGPQPTPTPGSSSGTGARPPDDDESGSPGTDDNSQETQEPSQAPSEQGEANAPPVD